MSKIQIELLFCLYEGFLHACYCDMVHRYRIHLVIYVQVLVKQLTAHRQN